MLLKSEDTDSGEHSSLSMNAFHVEAESGGLGRWSYVFSSLSDTFRTFQRESRKH